MVDRYTEWADWTGWADEPADRRPPQRTGTDSAEGSLHLFFCQGEGRGFESRRPLSINGLVNWDIHVR